MKKLFAIIALASAAFAASATAKEGYYVQGNIGYGSQISTPNELDLDLKKGGVTLGVDLGYTFHIDEQFSIAPQVGYKYVAQTKWSGSKTMTVDGEAFVFTDAELKHNHHIFDLVGVFSWNAHDEIELFAKAGLAIVHMNSSFSATTATVDGEDVSNDLSSNKTSIRPEIGLGIGYNITEETQFNVAWTHIFGSKQDINDQYRNIPSFTMVTAGIKYTF